MSSPDYNMELYNRLQTLLREKHALERKLEIRKELGKAPKKEMLAKLYELQIRINELERIVRVK